MEDSIISRLKALGYNGDLTEKANLVSTINKSEMGQTFILLIKWIVSQIKVHMDLQDSLSGDKESFSLELKAVLRELECPYYEVMQTDSLTKAKGKKFLLDFLLAELQSCRMNNYNAADENVGTNGEDMDTTSAVGAPVKLLLQSLNVSPVSNTQQLFRNIENKIREILSRPPANYLPDPLLQRTLDTNQWEQVSHINDAMCQDYKMRRQVLIKRADVTIQSFRWSEKLKSKENEVSGAFEPIRMKLHADSLTSVVDVLAARQDLCVIDKTSSGVARDATKCDINKTLIGKVPDRGGRPSATAPPPEMPAFQKRQPDTGRGGHRGGRGGGGGHRSGSDGGGGRGYQSGNGGGYQGGRGGNYQGGRGGGYGGGGRGWSGSGGRDDGRYGRQQDQRDQKMYYS